MEIIEVASAVSVDNSLYGGSDLNGTNSDAGSYLFHRLRHFVGFLLEGLEIYDIDLLDLYENAALRWIAARRSVTGRFYFSRRSIPATNDGPMDGSIDDARFRYLCVTVTFKYSTSGVL